MSVELRPAVPADADAIAAIWQAGWPDAHLGNVPDALVAARHPQFFLARSRELVPQAIVAVDPDAVAGSGAIVGFVVVIDDEVDQVYLAASHRGSGIATTLLRAAEAAVAANGHSEAWLAVVEGNARARRFYERNGWTDGGPFLFAAPTENGTIDVPCRRYVRSLSDEAASG